MRTRRSASQPTRPPRTGPVGPSPSGAARSPSSRRANSRNVWVVRDDGRWARRTANSIRAVFDARRPWRTATSPSATSRSIDRRLMKQTPMPASTAALVDSVRPELGHDVEVARADADAPQLALDHGAHAGPLLLHARAARRGAPRATRRRPANGWPGGTQQHDLVAQERLEQQRAVRPLGADDAELDLPVDDQRDHRVGVVDPQRDVHLGVPRRGTRPRIGGRMPLRRAGRRAERELAGDVGGALVERAEELVLGAQDALRVPVGRAADLGGLRRCGRSGRAASRRAASRARGWRARRRAA